MVYGARLNFRGSGLLERKLHILHLKIGAKNICWRCLCRLLSHKIFASLPQEPGEPLKFNCSKMRRIIQKIIMEKMRLSNANFGTIVTDMLQPLDDSEIDRFFWPKCFKYLARHHLVGRSISPRPRKHFQINRLVRIAIRELEDIDKTFDFCSCYNQKLVST